MRRLIQSQFDRILTKRFIFFILFSIFTHNIYCERNTFLNEPENPFLYPGITIDFGLSYGAEPIIPAPKVRLLGQYMFLQAGFEISMAAFVAGWQSHAWIIGANFGPISFGYKFASSVIGTSNDNASSYDSQIIFIDLKAYDSQFNSFSLYPGFLELGYTISSYNKKGDMTLPEAYLSIYPFGLPITIDLMLSGYNVYLNLIN